VPDAGSNTIYEFQTQQEHKQPGLQFEVVCVLIRLLSAAGDTMNHTMKKLAHKITNLPTEWRVRALNTVANLLELKVMLRSSYHPLIHLLRCCLCCCERRILAGSLQLCVLELSLQQNYY
jgi:hypothetical protein